MGMASRNRMSCCQARNAKQRIAGQVVHPPVARQAHERRIEIALMVRADQPASRGRPVLAPCDAQAEQPHGQQPREHAERVVAEALDKGALHGDVSRDQTWSR